MTPRSFAIFAHHLRETSGLVIRPDQDYLLNARLSSLLELYHCNDLDDLAERVALKADPLLLRYVTDAMATHETSFMRDPAVFNAFKTHLLPALMQRNAASKHLRFWSAGCAGGQEPYSLAMVLDEEEALRDWRIEIIATDASHDIITRAQNGVFSHFEAQRGLPARLLLKYFTQIDTDWRINDTVKRNIVFRVMNLLDDFASIGAVDAVFCRNVLIYLDTTAKRDIVTRFHRVVKPEGYMVLGTVEAFVDDKHLWTDAGKAPGIFRRI